MFCSSWECFCPMLHAIVPVGNVPLIASLSRHCSLGGSLHLCWSQVLLTTVIIITIKSANFTIIVTSLLQLVGGASVQGATLLRLASPSCHCRRRHQVFVAATIMSKRLLSCSFGWIIIRICSLLRHLISVFFCYSLYKKSDSRILLFTGSNLWEKYVAIFFNPIFRAANAVFWTPPHTWV